jgi:hypothetical protein
MPESKSPTTFLNVDLEIRAQSALEELLRYLEPAAFVLHQTTQEAVIELNAEYNSLEDCLVKWIALVQSVPEQARTIWDRCEFRRMNIGIQAGYEPHDTSFNISSRTVALLADLQTEIAFTVYAPND